MTQTVAIIPARGGSKGLPGKNIRPLAGKPMIQYTIEAALQCPLVDAVYVSTDDPAIAEAAKAGGSRLAPMRPSELATDTASTMDVLRHFLDWYCGQFGDDPDTLVLLQPTSPLRTVDHLTEALMAYQGLPQPATLVSVSPTKPLAWQAAVSPESGRLIFHRTIDLSANRQAEAPNYQLNGAIYIAPSRRYREDALLSDPVYPYIMPPETSVDVDTLLDFQLAEQWVAVRSGEPAAALVEG